MNKIFHNIQGLRAVAVISVILFHYQIQYFEGGFLGVDIFFVISGYLMTLLLDKELNHKSILEFYFRRIKRLLPALIFVVFISLILGFFIDFRGKSRELERQPFHQFSLFQIFFFLSFFWREWGYFDLYSLNKPLLHTWSLSLEMQFYIAFDFIGYK